MQYQSQRTEIFHEKKQKKHRSDKFLTTKSNTILTT